MTAKQDVKVAAQRLETAAQNVNPLDLVDGVSLAAALRGLVPELSRPPTVAVVGEFSAGKSSLVNALIGEHVLPTDPLPTTVRLTLLQYGERRGLVLRRSSGVDESREIDDIVRYGDKNQTDHASIADVDRVEVYVPHPRLREFRILDTPGLGDPDQDSRVTFAAVEQADALLWCTPAIQAWKATEARVWESVPKALRSRSILVITRADDLSDGELGRVIDRTRRTVGDAFARVVAVGLKVARNSICDGQIQDRAGWARSGMPELERALAELVVANAAALRSAWAHRRADQLLEAQVARLRVKNAEIEEHERASARATAGILTAWDSCSRELRDAGQEAAKDLRKIGTLAANKAKGIKKRGKFEVPQEIVEEGWFSDDHKVEWRTHRYDTLRVDDIPEVHKALHKSVDELFTRLVNEQLSIAWVILTQECELAFDTHLPENVGLYLAAIELLGALRAWEMYAAARLYQPASLCRGGINGGGLYAYYGISEAQIRDYPQGKAFRSEVNEWFCFDQAAEDVIEAVDSIVEFVDRELKSYVQDQIEKRIEEYKAALGDEMKVLTEARRGFRA